MRHQSSKSLEVFDGVRGFYIVSAVCLISSQLFISEEQPGKVVLQFPCYKNSNMRSHTPSTILMEADDYPDHMDLW